ncbi:MAG: glutamyl-tRNA reductase [Selenomonadaceae bacterium]|nr:glutamyl-tRNA reductase [Selenomonadaceae bacterium]
MHLICTGVNHRTASIDTREKFSLTKDQIRLKLTEFDEAVILSTCNRTEIYSVSENESPADRLHYLYRDEECVRHLFSVASSLDSLILGEGQILSQVKDAYRFAKDLGKTSTILNTLFNRAIACGKRVRNETRIAYNAVSVSYAAVELARKILGDLQSRKVLLFGAGKMARLSAQYLISHGVKKIFVANRHLERAQNLAMEFHGEAIPWERAFEVDADLIITSTGAPHYVIKKSAMEDLIRRRNGREILLIDIAVPRDVDPEVESLPNVKLFNIDDLESVVEQNLREREKESIHAQQIVEEEVQALMDRFKYLSFRPLMANLSERADSIRQREIRRAASKLPRLTSEEWKSIDQMTRMIVRKILRVPMSTMNSAAGTSEEQFYSAAMKSLFQLEENCK